MHNKISFKEEIERFIFDWNSFPLDFWWRKKYNIPFGSKKHREMSFIDMLIDWKEEKMMKKMLSGENDENVIDSNIVSMTAKEIDEDYENLDLSQFNS